MRFLRTDAHFLYPFYGILWHIVVYESYLRKKGLKGPVAKLSLTVRLQKQQDKCKQQIVFHVDAQEFGDITYAVVDY